MNKDIDLSGKLAQFAAKSLSAEKHPKTKTSIQRDCLLLGLMLSMTAVPSYAADYQWSSLVSLGHWQTATNWVNDSTLLFTYPNADDTANIVTPANVRLDDDVTVQRLSLRNGARLDNVGDTLSNVYTLTVNGTLSLFNPASASDYTSLAINESGTPIDLHVVDMSIEGKSVVGLFNQAELQIDGDLDIKTSDARFESDGNVFLTDSGSGTNKVNNNGLISNRSGEALRFARDGGAAEFDADGDTEQGRLIADPDGELVIALDLTDAFDGEASIYPNATLEISNPWELGPLGTLTFVVTDSLHKSRLKGGLFKNQGNVDVSGRAVIEADFEQDELTGQTVIRTDAELITTGSVKLRNALHVEYNAKVEMLYGPIVFDEAEVRLENLTELLLDGESMHVDAGSKIQLEGGNLRIAQDILFDDADSLFFISSGSSLFFEDITVASTGHWQLSNGELQLVPGTGKTTHLSGGTFTNAATVTLVNGTGRISADFVNAANGLFDVDGDGEAIFDGTATLAGRMTLGASNDDATFNGTTIINTATIDVSGSTLSLNGPTTIHNGADINIGDGGQVIVRGNTTINSATAIDFGTVSVNEPLLHIASGVTRIDDASGNFDWDGNSGGAKTRIDQGAELAIKTNRVDNSNDTHNGFIRVAGKLSVDVADDEWIAAGTLQMAGGELNGDTVRLQGEMQVVHSASAAPGDSVINANVIVPSGSTLSIGDTQNESVTFNGQVRLDQGANLNFHASHPNVVFNNISFHGPDLVSTGASINLADQITITADTLFNASALALRNPNLYVLLGKTLTLDGNTRVVAEPTANMDGAGSVKLAGELEFVGTQGDININVADFDLSDPNARLKLGDTTDTRIEVDSLSGNLGTPDAVKDVHAAIELGTSSKAFIDLSGSGSWNLHGSLLLGSGSTLSGDDIHLVSGGHIASVGGAANQMDLHLSVDHGALLPGGYQGFGEIGVKTLSMSSRSSLQIEVAGIDIEMHDKVRVQEGAQLGGLLQVFSRKGYTPALYDIFNIVISGGPLNGTFEYIANEALAADRAFAVTYPGDNTVRVTVARMGDANLDRWVDSADALLVNNNQNQPGSWADGDFNQDGTVDAADLAILETYRDSDRDNDGVVDNADAFPDDPNETIDSDNDGVGDNADAFPSDPSETVDSDNDGVGDNADVFPNDPSETADSDNDGVGDNADAFPNDPSETLDSDNDGFGDVAEVAAGSDPQDRRSTPATVSGQTVAITEFLSNLEGDDRYMGREFVELYNYGAQPVNLSGWQLHHSQGKLYQFGNRIIAPGDFFIVVINTSVGTGDLAKAMFEWEWLDGQSDPRVLVAHPGETLGDAIDELVLSDSSGQTMWRLAYQNDDRAGYSTYLTGDDFSMASWGSVAAPGVVRAGVDQQSRFAGDLGYQEYQSESGARSSTEIYDFWVNHLGVDNPDQIDHSEIPDYLKPTIGYMRDTIHADPSIASPMQVFAQDTDNDGVADSLDAFPNDPSETVDSDNDGVGDNADAFPNDPSETLDSDNDGVGDNADAFPNDPNRTNPGDSSALNSAMLPVLLLLLE